MTKVMKYAIGVMGAVAFMLPIAASANATTNQVTLNGGPNATVPLGHTAQGNVNFTISSGTDVESFSWQIVDNSGGAALPPVCIDSSDHTTDGVYNSSFPVGTGGQSEGTWAIKIRLYGDSGVGVDNQCDNPNDLLDTFVTPEILTISSPLDSTNQLGDPFHGDLNGFCALFPAQCLGINAGLTNNTGLFDGYGGGFGGFNGGFSGSYGGGTGTHSNGGYGNGGYVHTGTGYGSGGYGTSNSICQLYPWLCNSTGYGNGGYGNGGYGGGGGYGMGGQHGSQYGNGNQYGNQHGNQYGDEDGYGNSGHGPYVAGHGHSQPHGGTNTGSACTQLNHLLSLAHAGTHSQANANLQQFLGSPVTGYFGPITAAAVSHYEAVHGCN